MHDHFIGGRWIRGSGPLFTAADPASSHIPFTTRNANPDEVAQACAAAVEAFPNWAGTSFDRRAAIVENYSAILHREKNSLVRLISLEVGKPAWESRTEVDTMVRKVNLSIEAYKTRTGYKRQDLGDGDCAILSHHPHGIVAILGPFNFPGHLPNGHLVPSLLAGNTVVFKPSEFTPGVGAFLVRTWDEAGLPKGVLNMVQGDRATAIDLLEDPRITGVYFTGSAKAGIAIHRQFAGRPEVILALEMGGNNPLVVIGPDHGNETARLIAISAFITSGQRCTCARRLIVTPEAESVIEDLVALTKTIVVGSPEADPEPFIGPIIHLPAADRVLAFQKELAERGGNILEAARPTAQGLPFLRPGIVDVTGIANLPDEEIFGPLLQVIRVKSLEQGISAANSTRFGLAAGLIGGDRDQFDLFRRNVRAGVINWNRPTTGASSAAPFGGVGLSGNHRPTALYAADYCAYPVATMESDKPNAPKQVGMG
jgi:succinylglutamic semialdehyde dehydrogenase